jgi:hypothetical protein
LVLIHLIADYGAGDHAFAEVTQRLAQLIPAASVCSTPVPAFDTVSAGFCAAQLALGDEPGERLIYTNVAPRADHPDPRPGNQGERLVMASCDNGVSVVGVNSQHCFSFLRDRAVIRYVDVPDRGSQFRSRDLFPDVVARLARGDEGCLGAGVDDALIPPAPVRAVAYVDGYGNLKTTWSDVGAEIGSQVQVRVGGAAAVATVTDGTFGVRHGAMSFAPGSSGWALGSDRRVLYEVLLRGASAADRLGNPRAGSPVEIHPL